MTDTSKPGNSKDDGGGKLGGALRGLASELGVAQPREVEQVEGAKPRPASSTGSQNTDSGATEP